MRVFYEVQPWEQKLFEADFTGCVCVAEPLTMENIAAYSDAEAISVFIYSHVTAEIIDKLPKLKLITTRSTGFEHIDTAYAKSKGILVSNVPEYGSNTVAEHAFALILSLSRKVFPSILQVKNPDFTHTNLTGTDIFGKTIGVVGLGKIGLRVVQIARGFGMRVLVYNRTQKDELAAIYGFTQVGLNDLLSQSDVITFHLSLNPETKGILNMDNIYRIKKGAYLVNTARGGLIQTEALVWGLQQGIFSGIGLDVLEEEKELVDEIAILSPTYQKEHNLQNLIYNHMLLHHPLVIITPHNAFNSQEALARIIQTTISNIKAFEKGKPQNTVT
ncbi:MAG: NAD(P)-dependent oxidoreductase [Candidatus Roizmanbacteria bacterium]